MAIKILLIAVYRFNSFDKPSSTPEKIGIISVFLPLLSMVIIWLAACIPSLVSRTRSRLGTTIHIVFGIYVASVYWIIISMSIAYAKNVSLITAITAAIHFAWFCAPSHPDNINGAVSVSHVMRAALAVLMYYTLIRSPAFPHVSDSMFIITVWGPEIVNIILDAVFATVASSIILYYESSSRRPIERANDKSD
jgi:formate hydrogenlyase subunit 4